MAIKYDLIMDNNTIHKISYVCFGALNQLREGRYPSGHYSTEGSNEASFRVANIKYIRFDFKATTHNQQSTNAFLREFKILTAALPCIQDIMFVDGDYVYVRVKDQPADKVMFTLQMARNLAQTCARYSDFEEADCTYGILRNEGVHPLKALVADSLICLYREESWDTDEMYVGVSQVPTFGGESALFSFRSFGAESFRRFLAQDNYNPWYQRSFAEQGYGYMRSSHFRNENISYEGLSMEGVDTEKFSVQPNSSNQSMWYTYAQGGNNHNFYASSTRCLEDCHSIVGDQEPLFPNSYWDNSVGFAVPHLFSGSNEERFNAVIELLNSF